MRISFSQLPVGAVFSAELPTMFFSGEVLHQKVSETEAIPSYEMVGGVPLFNEFNNDWFNDELVEVDPALFPDAYAIPTYQ